MAVTDPSEKKNRQMLVLCVAIFVGILIYAIWTQGAMGVKAVIWTTVKVAIVVLIFIGIGFAVYKIFFEKKEINLIANDKQSIINAGTLCKPPLLRDLYFTGDKEHGEAKIGHIIGYCQIQTYEKAHEGKALPEDCFVFKTSGFPFSLFEEAKVFRCLPHEHSELVGDCKVYAISPVERFGYYFPNHVYLNVKRIDESVVKSAQRLLVHEIMKDLVTVTKLSMGLDSTHDKAIEGRKLLKIPTSLGSQEESG
jgi:hypothetical protein